ncbi:DUF2142 domain-containing protein [Planosporangium sp. 12N6]|uniref:DUF2142 domain-containing protein n=1 Tax=Planosporangium spinosum TaxID=3402278 RepID=UPI003CEDAC99
MYARRVFLLAFAAFFLMSAAWALALPVNGTYDEKHHVVRAYAVVTGHWLPDGPASDGTTFGDEGFDVPRSLLPANVNCAVGERQRGSAACQRPVDSREIVRVPSAAARYSPVYYLPVGLPLLVSPDATGVVLARLVSAAVSALLLAAAVVTAVRLRAPVLAAGVALVATPMAMNLNGSVNPNGLEISAGVLLFVTLSALLRGPVTRRLLVLAGVAAALLLTVRQLGPVLLAVDVAACVLLAGRARTLALLRDRGARWILGGFAAAGVAVVGGWMAVSGGADTAAVISERAVPGDLTGRILTERVPFYVHQIVGQFGYGEVTISRYAIYLWYLLLCAVVVGALVRGGWRLRLVLAGLLAFCAAFLVALDVHFAPLSGWFAQGRYALPTAVGVVLLAALAWPAERVAGRFPEPAPGRFAERVAGALAAVGPRLALGLVAVTVPLHLYALARVMTRFESGLDASLNPFAGSWRPATGPAVPLLAAVAGLAVLLAVMLITERSVTAAPGTVSGELDNGSVTPVRPGANRGTETSTTDTASH